MEKVKAGSLVLSHAGPNQLIRLIPFLGVVSPYPSLTQNHGRVHRRSVFSVWTRHAAQNNKDREVELSSYRLRLKPLENVLYWRTPPPSHRPSTSGSLSFSMSRAFAFFPQGPLSHFRNATASYCLLQMVMSLLSAGGLSRFYLSEVLSLQRWTLASRTCEREQHMVWFELTLH